MKKNDNRGLFDVFKDEEYAHLSFWEKLKYWFKNVYWCNYKGLTFWALFGIVCLGVFIGDVINQPNHDLDYVIAADVVLSVEQLDGIQNYITEHISDANGDGKVSAAYQFLPVTSEETYDQVSIVAEEKLFISLADDRVLMYITDASHMESMANDGAFEKLSTFGIESDMLYCIDLTNSELFKNLQIPSAEGGWFMGVKVIDGERVGNEEIARKYEAVGNLLKSFLK
ncbi:MAG: hypothetical protein IKU84_07410 [Clostridia bacterium]|nr:hypothetical protein [Clostridia bacterium]